MSTNESTLSTPASDGLTEAEQRALRDALVAAWRDDYSVQSVVNGLAAAVAQIKADAEAKARADERERIAQAIEALPVYWVPNASWTAWLEAARKHDAIDARRGDA